MKNKILLQLPLLGALLVSCTTDAGYDPSAKYAENSVDYIVDDTGNSSEGYLLPKCTTALEGKLFYINSRESVFACVDEYWVQIRAMSKDSPELTGLPYYNPNSIDVTGLVSESEYRLGSFTDMRDGRTYATVTIDGVEWMAQNLYYDGGQYIDLDECVSLLGASNCRLYTRYFSVGSYGSTLDSICPTGFSLPSEDQWDSLIKKVGGTEVAGKSLKSKTFVGEKNRTGADIISFNALPAGYRLKYNTSSTSVGDAAMFYTSDDDVIGMYADNDYVRYMTYSSGEYFSVRCVRSVQ